MKRTHIPFYDTYEAAQREDKTHLHYFKVVSQTEISNWYDGFTQTHYLLVDEKDQDIKFVAVYNPDKKKFIAIGYMPVQEFLNKKYDNDMHQLIAKLRANQ